MLFICLREFDDTKGADRNLKSEDRQDHGQQKRYKFTSEEQKQALNKIKLNIFPSYVPIV